MKTIVQTLLHALTTLLVVLGTLLLPTAEAWAADLVVTDVRLDPCPASDVASQAALRRPTGAGCWALSGVVSNSGRKAVVDTDVFALILDASGEPVLQNRSRVGSIGDVAPGRSPFALRLAVPMGTAGPLQVRNVKARGFSAPVRMRATEGDELLPLEQQLVLG